MGRRGGGINWNRALDAAHDQIAADKAAKTLQRGGGGATIRSPSTGSRRVSPREEKEADPTAYSGRVAARIRILRKRAGISRDQLQAALAQHGVKISLSALYAYENGNRPVHPDQYPAFAQALGCKSVRSFLPEN